jgi:hypothetical protein
MSTPSLARKPGSPLPRIDQVADSTAGSVLLCFIDCYSGYHQIALHPDDEDKIAFIMPHDIYCYKVKTFGLKNARATYQKVIQKCLKSQIGINVEAYEDDVVVKTTVEDKLIADLIETFANMREFQYGQAIQQERRHESYEHDGGSRSFH